MKIKNGTTRGWLTANEGDSIILRLPNEENMRGRVQHGITPTLCTGGDVGVVTRERERERAIK